MEGIGAEGERGAVMIPLPVLGLSLTPPASAGQEACYGATCWPRRNAQRYERSR
jgi:hypothetical protein